MRETDVVEAMKTLSLLVPVQSVSGGRDIDSLVFIVGYDQFRARYVLEGQQVPRKTQLPGCFDKTPSGFDLLLQRTRLAVFEQLIHLERELNTTDLQLALADTTDPVEPDVEYGYIARVHNAGPNPAAQVQLAIALPVGISVVDIVEPGSTRPADAECTEESKGTVSCDLLWDQFGF